MDVLLDNYKGQAVLKRLLLWLCLGAGTLSTAVAQPDADFSANVREGCDELVVSFGDASTGDINTWEWTFGDGSGTSNLENPTHFYDSPGTYEVTLTVSGPEGSDTESKSSYIVVHESPNNDFSADTTQGCDPLEVQFTDQSTPGDATITSREWDFGDGDNSTAQNPDHTYTAPGTYNVTLFTEDGNGCTASKVKSDFIIVDGTPKAAFTASDTLGCTIPFQVNFSNNSTGNNLSYQWDFGDGNTSTSPSPTHTYQNFGVYEVTLITTTDQGCADTARDTIDVRELRADFTVDQDAKCASSTFNFTDQSTPFTDSWSWDFGDGNTSTQQNPTHSYDSPGTYTVELTVTNQPGCSDTETKTDTITVHPLPDVGFRISDSNACELPFQTTFVDTTANASSWTWDFGDGTTGTGSNLSHTYDSAGVYDVGLTVTDNNGCTDSITDSAAIEIIEPRAMFQMDPDSGCKPLTVDLTDSSFSKEPLSDWFWDFGDGNTSMDQNPTHTYQDSGLYTITLGIENIEGCQDTLVATDTIGVGISPTADFAPKDTEACHEVTVPFRDSSSEFSTGWEWHFGDEQMSNKQHPEHTYDSLGYWDVTLVAYHHGCPDTIEVDSAVHVLGPLTVFDASPKNICTPPDTVNFSNVSVLGTDYKWRFGDGTMSTKMTPDPHEYDTPGSYDVSLKVENDTNSCADSSSLTVNVSKLEAGFSMDTTIQCNPSEIAFQDTSITNMGIDQWEWHFGDGDSIGPGSGNINNAPNTSGTYDAPIHSYDSAGVYDVTLIVTDAIGCMDTVTFQNAVNIRPLPDPAFTSDTTNGCVPLTIDFEDQSQPKNIIDAWEWSFGDGDSAFTRNPAHTYSEPGQYDVGIVVTDTFNCSDTLRKSLLINATEPNAAFTSDTLVCNGDSVKFTNNSTGADLVYDWDFDDGSPGSNAAEPTHAFTSNADSITAFDVSLTVTDSNGCTSTAVRSIYLDIPDADFTIDSTSIDCPPFNAQFVDSSSSNVTGWEWDFGDKSGKSKLPNPSHTYSEAGFFDVGLVVSTAIGCKDTLIRDSLIQVGGPRGDFEMTIDSSGCAWKVTFVSETENTDSIVWVFDDGATTSGDSVTHVYDDPGSYLPTMVLRDGQGCQVSVPADDPLRVTAPTFEPNFDTDPATCEAADGNISMTPDGDNPPFEHNWSTGDTTASVDSLPADTYTVRTVDAEGCIFRDTVVLDSIRPPMDAGFVTDTSAIVPGDSVRFTDSSTSTLPIEEWTWDLGDGSTVIDSTGAPVWHIYDMAGEIPVTLTIRTEKGCIDSVTKFLIGQPAIEIPNVFTPNGDGKNDVFRVNANGVEDFRIRIFNRWGELLFRAERAGVEWAGKNFSGEKVPEGTYFYTIKYSFFDQNDVQEKTGTVTLFR